MLIGLCLKNINLNSHVSSLTNFHCSKKSDYQGHCTGMKVRHLYTPLAPEPTGKHPVETKVHSIRSPPGCFWRMSMHSPIGGTARLTPNLLTHTMLDNHSRGKDVRYPT